MKLTSVFGFSHMGLPAAALLSAAMLALPAHGQSPIGTAFTYQGKLELSSEAVNGNADFQFRLFSSASGNTQIGSLQAANNVPVADGVFTVPIDFGTQAFNGDARWLEIAVRSPAGSGNFVILTPRQEITATPYALKVAGVDGHSLDAADGSPVNALFVNNSGDVGIGTTNPQAVLDIRSGNGSYWQIDHVNGDLHGNGGTDGAMGIYNDTAGPDALTAFVLNGAAQMVVNGGGGVGIGTTTPTRRLHVTDPFLWTARFENSHPIAAVVEFSNTASGALWELGVAGPEIGFGIQPGSMYFYQQGDPFGPPMVIAPNHWVGLGSTNPAFRLELPNIGNNDGRARANQWVTFSSKRWKENVETLDNALETIKQLRGVEFDWKPEHGGTHDIGFVAEEVGQIVPELVTWEKDSEFAQGLAYDRITALTVEAIKEQQAQIENLQHVNAELREQVEKLMQLVEAKEAAGAEASK